MSSKLDYLKKYGLPGGDDEGKKKKRRKKAPGGAKEKRAPAKSGGGGLRIIDDEADMPTLDKKRVNKAWEEEETEEEKPALVLDDPEAGEKRQSGSWTTVGAETGRSNGRSGVSGNNMNGEDISPPRRKRRERHDSPSDDGAGDASPPRRNPRNTGNAGDASPPRRRKRHDSSDDDASPPRRNARNGNDKNSTGDAEDASPPRRQRPGNDDGGRGRRHDSDSSPPRRHGGSGGGGGGSGDSSPPRRRGGRGRHDSRSSSPENKRRDDGNRSGNRGRDASPPRRKRTGGRRHDSEDDDEEEDPMPPSRMAGGGRGREDDASPPRRKRSSGGTAERDDASPPRRGGGERRRDSSSRGDDEERERRSGASRDSKRRRRHDSPEADKVDGGGGVGGRVKTSSGYYAGLQSGKDFKVVEQDLKRKHDEEMKGADKTSSGQGAQTVYRDKKGRKLDMLNEFMKSQDARAGKEVEEAKEQFAWGRGKVQKEEEKHFKEELENIAAEPFARTVDDARLEDARKAEIRADDPMAAYMAKKKKKDRAKSGKPLKPEYKGPAPKPNRFGIRPGYRWDGNDRGNGWESRIVAKGVDNNYKAELAYKWATADM